MASSLAAASGNKSYEADAVSARFDESDTTLCFDDVKVSWHRVFVRRDTDMCRTRYTDHAFQDY